MKPIRTGIVGAALLALTTVSAQADCAAEIARLTAGEDTSGGGISKDGSLAPLEGAADAAAVGDAAASAATDMSPPADNDAGDGAGIAKDGSHVPLETAGSAQPGIAMSGADAQAQQEGRPTAAEQAAGDTPDGSSRDIHIQAARDALAGGDEDACMRAIEAAGST